MNCPTCGSELEVYEDTPVARYCKKCMEWIEL